MADQNGRRVHLPPGSRNLPKGLRYDPRRKEYLIDIWADGKRIREHVGPNRRSAEAILAKKRAEVAEGKHLEKKKISRTTFSELADKYDEWAKSYKRSYRSSVKALLPQLLASFGELRIVEITPDKIDRLLAQKREEARPATCNRYLALISHMFTKASDWGMWEGENPCRKVQQFREDNARMRILTDEERVALLDACDEPLRTFVLAALDTGARRGELLKLQWGEVDLDGGTITILDRTSKSGRGRVIPLTQRLNDALKALTPGRFRGNHVFTHPNGEPFMEPKGGCSAVERGFKTALRKAGIEDFRFHDLRHDFGSRLAAQGAHPKAIQELMGHRTSHMTDRYLHFATSQKRDAISLLEASTRQQTGTKTDKGATAEATPYP
ncbi:tyrosine-type recombinase/integrase [Nitrospinota bacterium]